MHARNERDAASSVDDSSAVEPYWEKRLFRQQSGSSQRVSKYFPDCRVIYSDFGQFFSRFWPFLSRLDSGHFYSVSICVSTIFWQFFGRFLVISSRFRSFFPILAIFVPILSRFWPFLSRLWRFHFFILAKLGSKWLKRRKMPVILTKTAKIGKKRPKSFYFWVKSAIHISESFKNPLIIP